MRLKLIWADRERERESGGGGGDHTEREGKGAFSKNTWTQRIDVSVWQIYIDSRRVQDQFTPKPDQTGGRHRKRGHIEHLEIRHLEKKKKKTEIMRGGLVPP